MEGFRMMPSSYTCVISLLTAEQELALARQIKKGDRAARQKMIELNLRLVVKIARNYQVLSWGLWT
jgi:DNA-directed RNA polymerase sigma subunit (sigma70/sigma32)